MTTEPAMADMPLQPLQKVEPEGLGALIARAEEERWTELILLGPYYSLGNDRENWPEEYHAAPLVFQATEPIGDDGAQAIAALTGLHTLNLGNNEIGVDGAQAIAALTG
ncbi:MAG: leucine-rich repeat domain-containing protein, partial [Alphaproteobacteria bacterium]|nr:leucine-rich repeat domain-containing protein [Alphaproteobacteria bacterium]